METSRSIRRRPPIGQKPSSLMADEVIFRPWWWFFAWMWPSNASPFNVSGSSVGCFLPKVRSARVSLPPTFMSPSVWSRKGLFDSISWRFLESNFLIDSIPLGHASSCISFCSKREACCKLGVLWASWAFSTRLFHILPDVMSSVACLFVVK